MWLQWIISIKRLQIVYLVWLDDIFFQMFSEPILKISENENVFIKFRDIMISCPNISRNIDHFFIFEILSGCSQEGFIWKDMHGDIPAATHTDLFWKYWFVWNIVNGDRRNKLDPQVPRWSTEKLLVTLDCNLQLTGHYLEVIYI